MNSLTAGQPIDLIANALTPRCKVCALYLTHRDDFWALHDLRNRGAVSASLAGFLHSRGHANIAQGTVNTHFRKHLDRLYAAQQLCGGFADSRKRILETEPQELAGLAQRDLLALAQGEITLLLLVHEKGRGLTDSNWDKLRWASQVVSNAQRGVSITADVRLREVQTQLKAFELDSRDKERVLGNLRWLADHHPDLFEEVRRREMKSVEGATNGGSECSQIDAAGMVGEEKRRALSA